jgi:molybdopterin guanine dinucleotide-containing S/N-oxide reductase-like protein
MSQSGVKRYTNCTTAGPLFAHVKDGRIIRVEPMRFEDHEYHPWKLEVNGKIYTPPNKWPLLYWGHTPRKWVYENRVEYPLKRVDWDPKNNRNAQNRGDSGYVRISWEEAFNILTDEIKRMRETYGPSAILTGFSAHPEWGSLHYFFSDFMRFWNILGSTVREITPISWEGWFAGASFVYGYFQAQGIMPAPDTFQDISHNSEFIIMWGVDPITHNVYHGIDTPRAIRFWKEVGKKIILIDPLGNDSGMVYADKWIPIVPGTDAALAAAIAYEWITQETYDKAYLNTHSIGFDEEHLPEGAPKGYSFKNYILGLSDGVAKTPQWAEEITGVPARITRELAREWAAKPTCLWVMYGGACRRAYAHEFARMAATLQAMQGLGKPGVSIIGGILNLSGPYDQRQVGPPGYADGGMNGVCEVFYQNPVKQCLNELMLEKGVTNPPVKWRGGRIFNSKAEDIFREWRYPMEGESEVHMIWNRGSTLCNAVDHNRDVRVYQNPKIETIVITAPWFDRDCRYADLVLPTTTNFEREDLTEPGKAGVYVPPCTINTRCAVYHQQCIEPVGESKTDLEILTELAARLGILDEYTEGNSVQDWIKKLFEKSNIPMPYEEFKEKGYYVWPALPDYKPVKQMKPFYEDPEQNPLETPSGKLEIFSQWLFEEYGPDNPEIPVVPHYIPEWEGRYTEELVGQYPLQLLTTHPKFRFHGKCNGVSWMREVYKVKGPDGYEYEPLFMHPTDAQARGLKEGDIVRVFNDRGQILDGVRTTERLMPGVVWGAYGSWSDPLEPAAGSIDRGGDSNKLTPSRPMSEHHMGWACNSTLVEVEKADLDALAEKYPDGWAGKYATWNKE